MSQKIVKIDSQILDAFSTCERKMQYGFVLHLRPIEPEFKIQRGSLVHDIVQKYYEIFRVKRERLYAMTQAIEFGRAKLSTYSEIDIPRGIEILDTMREYFIYNANEKWIPLEIEQISKKVIYEDEELKLLYVCKIDLLVNDHPMGQRVVDHKTYDRWFDPLSLENQFTGYATVRDTNYLTVNKIGFQKSYPPDKKFRRVNHVYTENKKQEWIHNTARLVKDMLFCLENGIFPMRRTSCGMYGGCDYLKVCEVDPLARELVLEKLYKQIEPWNPEKIKADI